MPRITTTTNIYLNKERKYRMFVDMQRAIELIPVEKGEYLMADFQDESFVLYGNNPSEPCASVELNVLQKVYDQTDPQILEKVLLRLGEIAAEYCCLPPDHVYTYYRNAPMWTAAGVNIDGFLV